MVKKEGILVDHENHQGMRIENANEYTLKIVNVQQNIWKTNGTIFVTELQDTCWM